MKKIFLVLLSFLSLVLVRGQFVGAEDVLGKSGMMEASKSGDVGNKICPVSGEKIGQSGMPAATYEYKGKIYNFCCTSCIDEFKKDPEKYIKKVEEELKSNSSGAVLQENKATPESQSNEGMQKSHHH